MREVLTISVDKNFKTRVDKTARRLNISRSELVKKAIEKYIVNEEFRGIREKLVPYAEKSGYFTDDDIFKDIS